MTHSIPVIQPTPADLAEGLRLERKLREAHDLVKVAENQLNLYVAHLSVLYRVPAGYRLSDWLVGFAPAGEQPSGDQGEPHE